MKELAVENILNINKATELFTHENFTEEPSLSPFDNRDYNPLREGAKGQWYDRYSNKRKKHKKRH